MVRKLAFSSILKLPNLKNVSLPSFQNTNTNYNLYLAAGASGGQGNNRRWRRSSTGEDVRNDGGSPAAVSGAFHPSCQQTRPHPLASHQQPLCGQYHSQNIILQSLSQLEIARHIICVCKYQNLSSPPFFSPCNPYERPNIFSPCAVSKKQIQVLI